MPLLAQSMPVFFAASSEAREMLTGTILWLVILSLVVVFVLAVYNLFYGPLRKQERARFFVDLLERRLRSGDTAESTIIALAKSQDRSLDWRFFQLAAHLESGLRLTQALERVSKLIPPQICALFKAGEQMGDLGRVLPVCRQTLTRARSSAGSNENYFIATFLSVTPIALVFLPALYVYVIPKFVIIMGDLEVPIPRASEFIFYHGGWLLAALLIMAAVAWMGLLFHSGEPAGIRWLQAGLFPVTDWFQRCLPWKRKRLLRDFTAMLAVTLDAGLPEAEALRLAGDGTANWFVRKHAGQAIERLAAGAPLQDAVALLDDSGELRWRLDNARRSAAGFGPALEGWLETLESKAFAQEQSAAHALTTALVLINGLLLGMVAVAFFQILVSIIEAHALW